MTMRPLKITWRLKRPMIKPVHEIHLDSILARARVIEANEDWSYQLDLPLARQVINGDWCFKASALTFETDDGVRLVHFTRKTDVQRMCLDGQEGGPMSLKVKEILTNKGQLKEFSWSVATQVAVQATAWCIGDAERICELLARIPCIGKQARNGFGLIDDYTVQECEQAQTQWMRRALPKSFAGSAIESQARELCQFALVQSRFKPPYAHGPRFETLEPIG